MGEPSALEKREAVDVADGEVMPHVEIRTGPIGGKVVGIDERGVAAVGGIVYRVAISVGHAQREVPDGALYSCLQGMIDGIRLVPKRVDVVESRECGTNRSIADHTAASNRKVTSNLARNRGAIYASASERGVRADSVKGRRRIVWVLHNDWLAHGIRICRRRHRQKLVGIAEQSQVGAFASNVGRGSHEVVEQFLLNAQIPLLDVGPDGLVWNG